MSLLGATLALDVRLQARSKLYAIGLSVALLFGLLGRFLVGVRYADDALPALYLLALSGTTYMFAGSLVLLEKSDGTLSALRVTPLRAYDYIASKIITLVLFALAEGALIQAVGFWGASFNPLPLLLGALCLGTLNTLLAMGQVAPHDSVTSFLIPGALVIGLVLQLPFFYILKIGPPALWYLIPSHGPLMLMVGAFKPLEMWQWLYGAGMSAVSLLAAGWWARRRFAQHIGLVDGGSPRSSD